MKCAFGEYVHFIQLKQKVLLMLEDLFEGVEKWVTCANTHRIYSALADITIVFRRKKQWTFIAKAKSVTKNIYL